MSIDKVIHIDNVRLSDNKDSVIIIDQTKLPNIEEYIELKTPEDLFDAIYELKVRGAPAIGICAGYGLYVLSKKISSDNASDFLREVSLLKEYINSSRPTAVNLSYALNRVECAAINNNDGNIENMISAMEQESIKIHNEDMEMCRAISEYGLSLVKDGDGILTHCNAGPLATSRYGTGLGTLFLGAEKGYNFHVYSDETRPLLQGARLTAYELHKADIDVTLICDNMASIVMKQGKIQACFVGCDRVAANGDTANKIGTIGVAIIAKHYGIPFYVFCPSSTIDFNCKTGADIKIEEREPTEISTKFFAQPIAPTGIKCFNPAFDVTDNELITAIITEKGICRAPYTKTLSEKFLCD